MKGMRYLRRVGRLEMLAQRDALPLVVRRKTRAVKPARLRRQPLVNETAEKLPVLDHEGHLVRSHLEHRARAFASRIGMPESGIEKTRIVDAEFTDERLVSDHLRGVRRRHLHRML